jgi:hypothetical protein
VAARRRTELLPLLLTSGGFFDWMFLQLKEVLMLMTFISALIALLTLFALWQVCLAFKGSICLMAAALWAALRRASFTDTRTHSHVHAHQSQSAEKESSADIFHRLSCEAVVYSTQPYVSVLHHASTFAQDGVLYRTTADPYSRRSYIERLQLIGEQVVHVVCLYLDGCESSTEVGAIQFPAIQTDVAVMRMRIEDIASAGPYLSFRDANGRNLETRLPKEVRGHA